MHPHMLLLLSGTHELSWQHSLSSTVKSKYNRGNWGGAKHLLPPTPTPCFCCELLFGLYPIQVILAREASVRPSSMLDLNKETGIGLP